jgi:16S rRNA (cytosine967-C5)-methyltransferase
MRPPDPGREKPTRPALAAALAAIDGLAAGRPLAAALANALRDAGELGPKERRAAAVLARAVARNLRPLDLAVSIASAATGVKASIPADRSLLRLLAARLARGEAPARVLADLALPGPRRPRALDDAHLARIAAALPPADALPVPGDPIRALAQRRSVPDFLAARLADEVGPARADAILAGLNEEPRLDLRANRLLGDRDALAARLAADDVRVRPLPLAPDGLVADDRARLFGRAHAHGYFELQDEGSQVLALMGGPAPGETVVDLCAGSGGKTLALAAAVGRTGRVVACDAVARRLAELPGRVRRARAVGIVAVAGEAPPPGTAADLVLVDAPCCGIGGMRREPDLRWRLQPAQIDAFPARQLAILRRAAAIVRPGGRLVYATCSPFRAENEAVVEAFLAGAPEFAPADADAVLPPAARAAAHGPYLRLSPEVHGTGAFFGALLDRAV